LRVSSREGKEESESDGDTWVSSWMGYGVSLEFFVPPPCSCCIGFFQRRIHVQHDVEIRRIADGCVAKYIHL
jgi:hypothetical protein